MNNNEFINHKLVKANNDIFIFHRLDKAEYELSLAERSIKGNKKYNNVIKQINFYKNLIKQQSENYIH